MTLAATHQIAKVRGSTPALPAAHVDATIEFQSEMPLGSTKDVHAEEPRALRVEGDDVYVLSFLSGNGSAALTFDIDDPPILDLWKLPANLPDPPDRDVLRFDADDPGATGDAVLWRMGTLNFDLERGGPANHLYVSTVDFKNFTVTPAGQTPENIEGEFDYLAKGVGTHAIVHAAPTTGTPQGAAATTVVDLNDDARQDPALPADFRCAVPNDMAIQASTGRLFVACYETRNAAVVDLATRHRDRRAARRDQHPRGLRAARHRAPSRGHGGLPLPAGRPAAPGLQPRGARARHREEARGADRDGQGGLRHHARAHRSTAGATSSRPRTRRAASPPATPATWTATWTASPGTSPDFTGNLVSQPVGRKAKGTKVTMSLRGIEETPPFHWRGDRADLANFNPAFEGLLGGDQLSEPEMREFEAFVFSLSYPANPNLADDRVYSDDAQRGFDCFATHQTTHTVSKDIDGRRAAFGPNPRLVHRLPLHGGLLGHAQPGQQPDRSACSRTMPPSCAASGTSRATRSSTRRAFSLPARRPSGDAAGGSPTPASPTRCEGFVDLARVRPAAVPTRKAGDPVPHGARHRPRALRPPSPSLVTGDRRAGGGRCSTAQADLGHCRPGRSAAGSARRRARRCRSACSGTRALPEVRDRHDGPRSVHPGRPADEDPGRRRALRLDRHAGQERATGWGATGTWTSGWTATRGSPPRPRSTAPTATATASRTATRRGWARTLPTRSSKPVEARQAVNPYRRRGVEELERDESALDDGRGVDQPASRSSASPARGCRGCWSTTARRGSSRSST